ncbi:TonB-dependent receptor [Sphingobium boeckii]|uniref:Iron complex outermembrane receptor protein n=1 Tax=Sphingobium boeckii TaxID=1082345 RepID=A0A7W9AGG8_9SPHN|nr:TonB-dependent receptor [Sphingobium boeckii]MBB5684999.1 iron complex outermembrane receptor protein [Sphingobium boeckii]
MKYKSSLPSTLYIASAISVIVTATSAHAQSTDVGSAATPVAAEAAPSGPPEILVTARRRDENILSTPIAISALTSADLTARGAVTLQNIAESIPGLNLIGQASSGARSDRSFQAVVIRGITPSSTFVQTTSIFIDGVPVSSSTALQSITDPERIEVLKGPQSAYFGRQTFAGAINLVNKLPTDHLTAQVAAMGGTRGNYDFMGQISAPLIDDLLGVRITGRTYAKNGSYKNPGTHGQTLGDQSTTSGTIALIFTPASNFTAKAFGLISQNKDGAAATGLIPAYTITGPNGIVVRGQSNCNVTGLGLSGVTTNAWFCGVAPRIQPGLPSANTLNDAAVQNFLSQSTGLVSPSNRPDGYGLKSRFYHLHLGLEWKIGESGITLSSLTGANDERRAELADLDNTNDMTQPNVFGGATATRSYFDFPAMVETVDHDFSQEFRATFENGGRLHATVGASYLNAFIQGSFGGTFGNLSTAVINVLGASRAKTTAGFFGVGFDFTPRLTFNVDGRYQSDHLYTYAGSGGANLTSSVFVPAGFYPEGATLFQKTYNNFLPRVIGQFKITPDNMVYASYSKGVNPGQFNNFFTQPAEIQALALQLGLKLEVQPEKLDNFEIGFKGKLFDNHFRYSVAAYYAVWSNQINIQNRVLLVGESNTPYALTTATNSGRVNLKGLEIETTTYLTPELTLDLNGAINDSSIVRAVNAQVTAQANVDFAGKMNPQTSKYSGYAALEYAKEISSRSGLTAYTRADFSYKSGQYADISNTVRSADFTNANFRVGMRNEHASIELFVTNVLNDKAYYTIGSGSQFDNTFSISGAHSYSALIASLRELRTFGMRTSYKF